jgi:hypoxanthine phosphoribosyltransferase
MDKKSVSYEYISFIVDLLEQRVRKDYDFIVGVGRGGLIPATMLAYKLKKKVISFGINTYNDMVQTDKYVIYQPITIPTKQSRILVVDDICDTGNTFNIIRDIYSKEKHLNIEFASLFVKDSKSHLVDYYGLSVSDGIWLNFPWDSD